MSGAAMFKCPSCGGYLEFDPEGQMFRCPYCGATHAESEISRQSSAREKETPETEPQEKLHSYHCQSCGAEIVTDATTAATRCYYCHSPVVLADRLHEEFRPDGVIPFKLSRKAAEEKFRQFVKSKWFIDHDFFERQQMENFSGVYYPYWFADVDGEASFEGHGTRTSVRRSAKRTVTTTKHFRVEREAEMSFRSMARKALEKADGKLADGIHPYDLSEQRDFSLGYLSGFLAEKRDVEADAVQPEILREAQSYAADMMRENTSFDTLQGETEFTPKHIKMRYMLLPAWVLTYRGGTKDKPYYYMMNGQTGAVCGRLPLKKGKLLLWSLLAGAAACAVMCLGGAMLW